MGKVLRGLEAAVTYLAGLSVTLMMLLTTVDAAGRYCISRPFTGAYEITENYLMTVAFLGVYYAYRQGAHIRLTFVMDHVPRRIEVYINFLVQVICVVLALALVIATTRQVFHIAAQKTITYVASNPIMDGLYDHSFGIIFHIPGDAGRPPPRKRGEIQSFQEKRGGISSVKRAKIWKRP